jgi:hypothetical protein
MIGAKMKWVSAALFALALAGCADSGSLDREKSIDFVPPTEQVLPPTKPVRPKALTAKAEASKPNAAKEASLLECVSDACKAQCSLRIEKQSRPKWCLYFKEPIDRPAASAPPEQPKLGSS